MAVASGSTKGTVGVMAAVAAITRDVGGEGGEDTKGGGGEDTKQGGAVAGAIAVGEEAHGVDQVAAVAEVVDVVATAKAVEARHPSDRCRLEAEVVRRSPSCRQHHLRRQHSSNRR